MVFCGLLGSKVYKVQMRRMGMGLDELKQKIEGMSFAEIMAFKIDTDPLFIALDSSLQDEAKMFYGQTGQRKFIEQREEENRTAAQADRPAAPVRRRPEIQPDPYKDLTTRFEGDVEHLKKMKGIAGSLLSQLESLHKLFPTQAQVKAKKIAQLDVKTVENIGNRVDSVRSRSKDLLSDFSDFDEEYVKTLERSLIGPSKKTQFIFGEPWGKVLQSEVFDTRQGILLSPMTLKKFPTKKKYTSEGPGGSNLFNFRISTDKGTQFRTENRGLEILLAERDLGKEVSPLHLSKEFVGTKEEIRLNVVYFVYGFLRKKLRRIGWFILVPKYDE